MDEAAVRELIDEVRSGRLDADDAVRRLQALPFTDLGHSRIDHHRSLRTGMAETVYAPGKTVEQVVDVTTELLAGSDAPVLVTRADPDQAEALVVTHPGARRSTGPAHAGSPTETLAWRPAPRRDHHVALVTAGTSDLPVAGECAAVLAAQGVEPVLLRDVGVAGLHRLLGEVPTLQAADAVIVVAGMEGALASVVGGLTGAPTVAVPTSAGYGAALEGVTALLSMLSSCASGVTVVGIDNGFGAACAVLRNLAAGDKNAPDG